MFGRSRHKSNTEKFVISKGVDAGNLKGRGTHEKTAPGHKASPLGLPSVGAKNREDYSVIRRGKS